jgi:predicted transcriptional regulator
MKRQTSIRLANITDRQLDQLAKLRGQTRTELIAAAVEQLHRQTHDSLHVGQADQDRCPWCGWTAIADASTG